MTRLTTRVLDYWSEAFQEVLTPSTRDGERYFHREDIKKIFQIKELFVIQRRKLEEVKDVLRVPRKQPNIRPEAPCKPAGIPPKETRPDPKEESNIIPIKQNKTAMVPRKKPRQTNSPDVTGKLQLLRRGLRELLTILDKSDKNNS